MMTVHKAAELALPLDRLQRTSCDNTTPTTAPGIMFPCPRDYDYAPVSWPPSITTCCKVSRLPIFQLKWLRGLYFLH
jgi:hypothetical protein